MPDEKLNSIISGLQYTVSMICFNPSTGEIKDPAALNEADKTTYDACLGAVAILTEQDEKIKQLYDYILGRGKGREIQKEDINTAFGIIEDVLDDLIEVGNGTTDKMLHADADKLFGLRYYLKSLFRPDDLKHSGYEHDKKQWEAAKNGNETDDHSRPGE